MRFFWVLWILLLIAAGSCNFSKDRLDIDVSDVNIPEVRIHRYDVALFRISSGNLQPELKAIQKEYAFFLGTDLDDPANLASMNDYLQNQRNRDFAEETARKFPSLKNTEAELTEAFRHVVYYFPGFKIPRIYAYISGGDYENPVSLADSVLLIAIDCYLGKDYKPYHEDGLPVYKTERMIPGQIVPDCMRVIAQELSPQDPANLNLLEMMVEAGKRIYLTEAFLPRLPDDLLMKYPTDQAQWVKENESHIWAAIIENKMLYSTEGRTLRTFLADGPFTPEFSKSSPARLGEWIGLQIIRSYMEENEDVQMKEMLATIEAQRLLQHSGYKPEKD